LIEVQIYRDASGRSQFEDWFSQLGDERTRARIAVRLERITVGHFGDVKSVGDGVFELRLHFGSGYRIYFVRRSERIILLLAGGDKSTQQKDIRAAKKLALKLRTEKSP